MEAFYYTQNPLFKRFKSLVKSDDFFALHIFP